MENRSFFDASTCLESLEEVTVLDRSDGRVLVASIERRYARDAEASCSVAECPSRQ